MDALRRWDDQLLLAINSFARHTTWLHGPALAYANYALVLFALLLVVGVLISRGGPDRDLAAAGRAGIAMLVALGLNQPFGALFAGAGPTSPTRTSCAWQPSPPTSRSLPIMPSWAGRLRLDCCWSTAASVCLPAWRGR